MPRTTSLKLLVLPICAVSAVQLFVASSAAAQVGISGYSLPLNLANEAAIEAVRICDASGLTPFANPASRNAAAMKAD
jgi:hypothetical protein